MFTKMLPKIRLLMMTLIQMMLIYCLYLQYSAARIKGDWDVSKLRNDGQP